MEDFRGKTVIVTGASSGIGLAAVKAFAARGARVVMAARSWEKMQALAAEIFQNQEDVLCIKTDVSVEEDCRRMVEETLARFGRIDILVNNAGISMRATVRDVDMDVIRRLMDVNFYGTVYCTKYALPHLLSSRGQVVGVVSIAGYASLPSRSAYSASKHAVRGFLETLRIEHLKDGLNVLVFAPGYTASNVRRFALLADGSPQGDSPRDETRMMSAEQCARHLLHALERRRREVILTPLGKATVAARRLIPACLDRLTYRFIAREKDTSVH